MLKKSNGYLEIVKNENYLASNNSLLYLATNKFNLPIGGCAFALVTKCSLHPQVNRHIYCVTVVFGVDMLHKVFVEWVYLQASWLCPIQYFL